MRSRTPVSATPATESRTAAGPNHAALGPSAEPVSAEANPAPRRADTNAEAVGRRTLSTAFVRVGPDGFLTVELRKGGVLLLRDVVMRPKDYCGVQAGGARYCGGYAEVAAARPGGAPLAEQPDLAVSNPLSANPSSKPK